MNRPNWTKLYHRLNDGDTVIFDSVSRMSRDAEDGFAIYEDLFNHGISLVFLKEPHINTDTYRKALTNGIPLTGTNDGPMLLDKYIVQTLFPGAMLSLCVLKRYLRRENGSKEHRTKKMLDYSKWVTKMSPDCYNLYGTSTQISNRKDHFQALSLSPVYVNGECPYIPSFSDMLNGTVNQRLLNFAWQATKYKQKDLTYWIFDWQNYS